VYAIDMSDIKTNIRDGAYVALGAAALGVQQLSKKRDVVMSRFDDVSSRIEPVVRDMTTKISPLAERVAPMAERVSSQVLPAANVVAEKVSTTLAPVASSVVVQLRTRAEQALASTKKIADEAKRRVS
jgi:hypothetical protein